MTESWTADESFWRHRSVAVTGATGFLGSHLVNLLLDVAAEVVILVRDTVPETTVSGRRRGLVSEVRGAVEDQQIVERMLAEYRVQTVFHLAAQSQVEVSNMSPVSTFESNTAGTWTVLEACRRSLLVRQVVVASSDKAYGDQAVLPYTEDMELRAVHPYDVSKACADMIARSYAVSFDLPVVVTRCGNFFGPGDTNWRRLVPGTVRSVLEGNRPVIRSDGSLRRDYLYVVDGALTYLRLAEALAADPDLAGQAFNFSTEQPLSVLELVDQIQKAAGTAFEPEIQAVAHHEIQNQSLSAAKARRQLGWRPRYTIEGALAETVAWYRYELGLDPA